MKREMNNVLQAGIEEEQLQEKKQYKLKKKFGIEGKNVVVVERDNTFKFTVKTIQNLIRLVATVIIIGLAFVGILALFYEEPRQELLVIFRQVYDEMKEVVPVHHLISFE